MLLFKVKLINITTRKVLGRVEVNHMFGEGTSPKLRKIAKGISLLIDKDKSTIQNEDFFSHNVKRKNYIFYYQNRFTEGNLSFIDYLDILQLLHRTWIAINVAAGATFSFE